MVVAFMTPVATLCMLPGLPFLQCAFYLKSAVMASNGCL